MTIVFFTWVCLDGTQLDRNDSNVSRNRIIGQLMVNDILKDLFITCKFGYVLYCFSDYFGV